MEPNIDQVMLAHNLVLARETFKHREMPSGLDLRLILSGAMFALSKFSGTVVKNICFSSFCDCAENVAKYRAEWPSKIQWGPKWFPKSTN